MAQALVDARALSRHGARAALGAFFRQAQARREQDPIPPLYWSVRAQQDGQLLLSGVVLLRVFGTRALATAQQQAQLEKLPPELEAALSEPASRPGTELLRLLRQDGWLAPIALFYALSLSALCKVFEAVLWLGLFELGRTLGPSQPAPRGDGCLRGLSPCDAGGWNGQSSD